MQLSMNCVMNIYPKVLLKKQYFSQEKPARIAKKITTYPVEFRKSAVELADEIGTVKASKHLKIPCSNISYWRTNMKDT